MRNLEDGSGNVTLQAFEKLMSYYGYELDACMIAAITDKPMPIIIQTYGRKYNAVPDSALDCTGLVNPYRAQALRDLTGLDQKVQNFVLNDPDAEALIQEGLALAKRDGEVSFWCIGGMHRSVVIAEAVTRRLQIEGIAVKIKHNSPKMTEAATKTVVLGANKFTQIVGG